MSLTLKRHLAQQHDAAAVRKSPRTSTRGAPSRCQPDPAMGDENADDMFWYRKRGSLAYRWRGGSARISKAALCWACDVSTRL